MADGGLGMDLRPGFSRRVWVSAVEGDPRGRQRSASCGGPVARGRGAEPVSRGRRPRALRATSSDREFGPHGESSFGAEESPWDGASELID